MLVTEEKVEGILEYLSQSDDDYGKLSARVYNRGVILNILEGT